MKVSDVYPSRSRPAKAKPEPKPIQSLEASSMLCRRGVDIWLNHKWGPAWQCTRCGAVADIKGLLSK